MFLYKDPNLDVLTAGRDHETILSLFLSLSELEFPINCIFVNGWVPIKMNRIKKLNKVLYFHYVFITFFLVKHIWNCKSAVAGVET